MKTDFQSNKQRTDAGPVHGIIRSMLAWEGRIIPPELLAQPGSARHATLVTRFGALGAVFGFSYATFYFFIGHIWGMAIILLCSSAFAMTPLLMRWTKSTELAGHFFSMTLTLGFLGLCFVEGGAHGHAIAWLVSVPLCALLLIGKKSIAQWVLISFAAASVVVGFDLAGVKLPLTYDAKWEPVVSAAGYLGLVLFMVTLGLIFEVGRERAADKMQRALTELAASNERLVHLNNEKNEFLGIAAHDLKTPLTMIIGSTELLMKTESSEQSRKREGNIISAARRMRNLINNLLDVHAIEQGAFMTRITRCHIDKLIEDSVAGNQFAADTKQIAIRVDTGGPLVARADRAAVLQILDNLISNALKFSEPNTTIHVESRQEKDLILVTVRDEGPGISEEDQKKLFRKFSRLSARPTGSESSTGLGLAIVKRLAEAMSGAIHCRSAPGMGTAFILQLPAWQKELPDEKRGANVDAQIRVVVSDAMNMENKK